MNSLANIKTITKRELGAYFSSPLAYIFIVIFLLLCGFFTFMVGGFFERGEASLVRPFFDWHPWFYLFLALALALTFPVVMTVNYLGTPDNGVIFCGYIGSWLMAGAYLAISCITSAMTRTQVVSFIISVVVCLFFILAGFPPVINMLETWAKPWMVDMIASFSVITHFEGFQKGVLDSRDVIFFLSLIGFSLFTTSVILREHRTGLLY